MHKLLTDQVGDTMLLLGNEAIARGAVEAGVAFASTYPGTPSSEIALNLFQISQETDLYFEFSTNEQVALEVAAAAANCGVRSMVMMKHVGLNVAADALMTLAYVGVKAGMVILTADDPSMFSSQNEQDNRYYAKFAGPADAGALLGRRGARDGRDGPRPLRAAAAAGAAAHHHPHQPLLGRRDARRHPAAPHPGRTSKRTP